MSQGCPSHFNSASVKKISEDQDGFYITSGSTQRHHMFPP